MTDHSIIPADDPGRTLTVAGPDDPAVRHVSVVGDTYSILVSGAQTAGRCCLIDMLVPDGGGPPAVGVPMDSRPPPPKLDAAEMAAKGKLAKELAPQYRTEML